MTAVTRPTDSPERAGEGAAPALVTVVREWRQTGPRDRREVWHLARGPRTSDWQDVWCGGGIAFPGRPYSKVPPEKVCTDCTAARSAARKRPSR